MARKPRNLKADEENKESNTPTKVKPKFLRKRKPKSQRQVDSRTDSDSDLSTDTSANEKEQEENWKTSKTKNRKEEDKITQTAKDEPVRAKNEGKLQTPRIFVVILSIALIGYGLQSKYFMSASISIDNINIEQSLKELQNDFQKQSLDTFRKLRRRILSYIQHRTSPQPFVLMVASTIDGQSTARCFATRVAKLFAISTVTVNGSKYSTGLSADDAKLDIDNKLRNVFQNDKFPTAAVIHNLDSVPFDTTQLFYAYCDHDNPMYKEATIIFTITLPQNYQVTGDEVDREGLVEKYLSEESPWMKDANFSVDILGALISRITDTVIVVNKESDELLGKLC